MGRSRADAAAGRARDREQAVREALAAFNSRDALWIALKGIASEAAKLRDVRWGDGMLTDADLAGSLLAVAAGMHEHRPPRPAGCGLAPGPRDLLAALDDSLARASEGREA